MRVFRLEITTRKSLTIEVETYEEAVERAASIAAESNAKHHHGEVTTIAVIDPNAKRDCYYFGCIGQSGHYMFGAHGDWKEKDQAYCEMPWGDGRGAGVDGTLLNNAREPDQVTGRVVSTVGKRGERWWWVFAWWDRSVDSRPGSNSALFVSGFGPNNREAAFKFACEKWPQVVSRQKLPLVLV